MASETLPACNAALPLALNYRSRKNQQAQKREHDMMRTRKRFNAHQQQARGHSTDSNDIRKTFHSTTIHQVLIERITRHTSSALLIIVFLVRSLVACETRSPSSDGCWCVYNSWLWSQEI
jgi:hypothetical protein